MLVLGMDCQVQFVRHVLWRVFVSGQDAVANSMLLEKSEEQTAEIVRAMIAIRLYLTILPALGLSRNHRLCSVTRSPPSISVSRIRPTFRCAFTRTVNYYPPGIRSTQRKFSI